MKQLILKFGFIFILVLLLIYLIIPLFRYEIIHVNKLETHIRYDKLTKKSCFLYIPDDYWDKKYELYEYLGRELPKCDEYYEIPYE
jgi:hypothetical protein